VVRSNDRRNDKAGFLYRDLTRSASLSEVPDSRTGGRVAPYRVQGRSRHAPESSSTAGRARTAAPALRSRPFPRLAPMLAVEVRGGSRRSPSTTRTLGLGCGHAGDVTRRGDSTPVERKGRGKPELLALASPKLRVHASSDIAISHTSCASNENPSVPGVSQRQRVRRIDPLVRPVGARVALSEA
jgi:hypothetical protein